MITISNLPSYFHHPSAKSHKGQNGRLLIIGGSKLFHAASLWSLTVASRIVDLVHYASVEENNEIVRNLKTEFRNGIVIHRKDLDSYIEEDDVILIGPGMVRANDEEMHRIKYEIKTIEDIEKIEDEGIQTYYLTNYLLKRYPTKQWVIDAGALQMMDLSLIPPRAILTPHHGEFERMKHILPDGSILRGMSLEEQVSWFAKTYDCIVLHKGADDIAAKKTERQLIRGGNAGMTKGGTGDVLAGLIAALACTHDPWKATVIGSLINKQAGDDLSKTRGNWYNASDLADQIPLTMNRVLSTDEKEI